MAHQSPDYFSSEADHSSIAPYAPRQREPSVQSIESFGSQSMQHSQLQHAPPNEPPRRAESLSNSSQVRVAEIIRHINKSKQGSSGVVDPSKRSKRAGASEGSAPKVVEGSGNSNNGSSQQHSHRERSKNHDKAKKQRVMSQVHNIVRQYPDLEAKIQK